MTLKTDNQQVNAGKANKKKRNRRPHFQELQNRLIDHTSELLFEAANTLNNPRGTLDELSSICGIDRIVTSEYRPIEKISGQEAGTNLPIIMRLILFSVADGDMPDAKTVGLIEGMTIDWLQALVQTNFCPQGRYVPNGSLGQMMNRDNVLNFSRTRKHHLLTIAKVFHDLSPSMDALTQYLLECFDEKGQLPPSSELLSRFTRRLGAFFSF